MLGEIPGNSGNGKSRFSTLLRGRALCSSWEKKMAARSQKKAMKEHERGLREAKEREKEEKRQRREANLKRRLENERRSEVVEVVNNPLKLKRLKKKQLRRVEKRDTLVVGRVYGSEGGRGAGHRPRARGRKRNV